MVMQTFSVNSRYLKSISLGATFLFSISAFANTKIDSLPSHQSFSGLTNTPNAQVVKTGSFNLYYGQGVPYQQGIGDLDDWVGTFGLFPGIEVAGRIVTQTYDCNIYTDSDCGIRDLSASAKYQIPYVYQYTGFNLAIGTQDIGGAANNFQTTYIVADKSFETLPVRLSAGYGKSKLASGIMDGPFAGIEIQPLSFLQLTGEYDATEFNSSVKAVTPEGFLPYHIQASVDYQVYSTRESDDKNIWGVSVTAPLVGYNDTQPYQKTHKNIDPKQQLQSELSASEVAGLAQLTHRLKQEGFINIQVGKADNKIVIALENRRYNRNQIDGAGVALGIITANAGQALAEDLGIKTQNTNIEMVMLTNGIPMLSISTDAECYRQFLLSGINCKQIQISTKNLTATLDKTQWQHQKINSGIGRAQVILSPAVRYSLATEYGVLDYSLALASNVYVPLWQGSAIDIRYLLPVDDSDDYQQGGLWANSQYESEIDRAVVHQAFRLPFNLMTQFSAGYVNAGYIGAANETIWYSPEGYHSLGVQMSQFTYKDDTDEYGNKMEDKSTMLGSYTLSIPEYSWQLNLTAGEFWEGDHGYQVTTNHWLGDAKVYASYLNSDDEQFVTVGVSFPLSFWRSMKPGYVQVRGIDEFTLSAQTRVGNSHNNLNSGLGTQLEFQHNLKRQYFNRDRLTPSYFESNTQRLRNAYIRYLSVK
ncbi:MAG: YjbH domain-containing protein [Vibrio hibernica]